MRAALHGDIRSLKPSEKRILERLGERRSAPEEILDAELCKRACAATAQLGRYVGLLIGRDGRVTHVVLGPVRANLPS